MSILQARPSIYASKTFIAALKKATVPVTFIVFENGGHIGGGLSSRTVGAFFLIDISADRRWKSLPSQLCFPR